MFWHLCYPSSSSLAVGVFHLSPYRTREVSYVIQALLLRPVSFILNPSIISSAQFLPLLLIFFSTLPSAILGLPLYTRMPTLPVRDDFLFRIWNDSQLCPLIDSVAGATRTSEVEEESVLPSQDAFDPRVDIATTVSHASRNGRCPTLPRVRSVEESSGETRLIREHVPHDIKEHC
jgi:hypothetical protein